MTHPDVPDLHRTAWASRVAADATDRKVYEEGRDEWNEADAAFYGSLVYILTGRAVA